MADEKKTYLIEVKSNLDKYAKEAADARKKVEELTIANLKMQASDKATTAEKEASNAALRTAKKEYGDAKKMVDLQTAANNSEAGSRKHLGEVLRLQERELGKLGKAYIINAKGVRELNPLYVEQRKRIKETKDAIIEYDKSLGDGRSSIGLYSEAIEGSAQQFAAIPGPIGQAGQAISRYSKILLANPIVLIITAIVAALAALVKAFKSTDSGGTAFAARFEQIKAILDIVRQRLVAVTDAIGHVFKGEWKEAGQAMKEAFTGIGDAMRDATNAAYDYTYAIDALEDAEANFISQSAENRNKMAKLEYTAQDATKSTAVRRKALIDAMAIGMEEVEAQKAFAEQRLNAEAAYLAGKNGLRQEDVIAFIKMTDEEQANASEALKLARDNNEEKFKELEQYYANVLDLDTKFFTEQKRNISRLSGFENAEAKIRAAADLQIAKDANTKSMEDFRDLVNGKKIEAVKVAKETGEDVLVVQKQYAAAEVEIAKLTNDEKLALASNFAGNIATIFGEQSAIGKAAAVVQTTIDTYVAAMAAYKSLAGVPVVGPALGIAAAAAATAAGIATVKKILAVDTGGQEAKVAMKASMPTAIVASAPAQRSIAAPAGSTIFTQPQLSQQQLNALPQQSMLSAEDIAQALSRMPAPKVSVEDINARMDEVKKVKVRADI